MGPKLEFDRFTRSGAPKSVGNTKTLSTPDPSHVVKPTKCPVRCHEQLDVIFVRPRAEYFPVAHDPVHERIIFRFNAIEELL